MAGLIEEGQETITEGKERGELAADLALIAAAQKIEHYEICGYGAVRALARQIGETQVATLLDHTLGEEESADYLLTEVAKPVIQDLTSNSNADVRVERHKRSSSAAKSAAAAS